nr:MAG TPA: hypothetical protein [Caudoviricetes sp.]
MYIARIFIQISNNQQINALLKSYLIRNDNRRNT